MSLLFGNLTNAFVDFGTTTAEAAAGNQTAKDALPASASHFKHTAANDASYLVYIGQCWVLRIIPPCAYPFVQVSACLSARTSIW